MRDSIFRHVLNFCFLWQFSNVPWWHSCFQEAFGILNHRTSTTMRRERTVAPKCLLKQQKYEGYSSFQALTSRKLSILTAVKSFTSIAVPSINHRVLKRAIKVHTQKKIWSTKGSTSSIKHKLGQRLKLQWVWLWHFGWSLILVAVVAFYSLSKPYLETNLCFSLSWKLKNVGKNTWD